MYWGVVVEDYVFDVGDLVDVENEVGVDGEVWVLCGEWWDFEKGCVGV